MAYFHVKLYNGSSILLCVAIFVIQGSLFYSHCPSLQRDTNKVNKKQDPGLNDHNYGRAAATRWRRNSSTAPTKYHTFVKE
jgi:hypothetical protein